MGKPRYEPQLGDEVDVSWVDVVATLDITPVEFVPTVFTTTGVYLGTMTKTWRKVNIDYLFLRSGDFDETTKQRRTLEAIPTSLILQLRRHQVRAKGSPRA